MGQNQEQHEAGADERDAQRAQKELTAFGAVHKPTDGRLVTGEKWWADRYELLKEQGYLLRPRFSPGWVPSWENTNKHWLECEDGQAYPFPHINDATRLSDGKFVTLKRIKKSVHPHEADIGLYFSSGPMALEAANHCVPLDEVMSLGDGDDGDAIILVMPLLRSYTSPEFDTFGEVVECFRQLFEGLDFMHKHRVAHRDCMNRNIMFDASQLYPKPFHPVIPDLKRDFSGFGKHYSRTERSPKYYFIDFGISRRYDPSDPNPLEVPIWGGDKEVPEFQNSNDPCNPFPTDVFYIGNAIMEDFINTKRGFQFIEPLVSDMVQPDSTKRPTMEEVVARFDKIHRGLSRWKLRSRVVDKEETALEKVTRTTSHWTRRIGFIARRVPATRAPS
ncbi:hypothetical protein PAXRUDRAFT_159552 [Paxillus rubicundulus Ve08.2h10]|uniref:Protein kinase domain-containing protein n=1 Tax=Paxillus rubicundulus Ve08.2h10 TaxID=930991 RepID=A0A0D0DG13_9AGAM|nr:hypothetical protein PAXRUDRAFT_159552 [Paxillus rubicundulus Ve08.2h10]